MNFLVQGLWVKVYGRSLNLEPCTLILFLLWRSDHTDPAHELARMTPLVVSQAQAYIL